jgi:hypothetical protein
MRQRAGLISGWDDCARLGLICLAVAPFGTGCRARDGDATSQTALALTVDPPVAISQVYGGGGNASAAYLNDFVELHNRTSAAVALGGMSLQYASATGTGGFGANSGQLVVLAGTLPAGGYYLVKLASGGTVGAALPAADASNTALNMAAASGKLALVNGTTSLGCNGGTTPCDAAASARIVDLVGYGAADYREGAATPVLSATTAALRKIGGCADSNDNASDFDVASPSPRNTASAALICAGPSEQAPAIATTTPAPGATGVAPAVAVQVTFTEPVSVTAPWFSFVCTASGSVAAAVSGGPTTFTLTPPAPLIEGESCQIVVTAAAVADLDSFDPPDQMVADHSFDFAVAAAVTTMGIHDVQGAAHLSPLAGQTVIVGPAVVTARKSNGFYLEDLAPDADPATSEGIFVFTSSAPSVVVGDVVTVRGAVSEFRPGCSSCSPSDSAFANLTTTELISPQVTVQSHGHALPAPQVLGSGVGQRRPPDQIIEDDAPSGDVETSGVFDPSSDGIDFYESLEGMRVQLGQPVAVSPTKVFSGGSNEIAVLAGNGADATVRTPRGGIIVGANDLNPERVILENSLTPVFPTVTSATASTARSWASWTTPSRTTNCWSASHCPRSLRAASRPRPPHL